jgi:hypothetical protein
MKRSLAGVASIVGVLVFSVVVALAQPPAGSEHESHHPATPAGMGMGMMGDQGMMSGQAGGSGMMSGQGMMGGPCMMGMQMMMSDPKTRGQMMEIHGRMMKEMGDLMIKRGQELEQGK